MHEIFLSTMILGKELDFYLRVLQGVCIMQPNHFFHRRVVFEGPRGRQLKGIDPTFIKQQGPLKAPFWQSLHEQLVRQSYYVTGIWEIGREGFGKKAADGSVDEGSGAMDCNALPGTLRWVDLPDPPNVRKVNSRHIIHIENEKNICEIMKRINYRLWAENFRESYQFVHKNVVIEFTRFFRVPNQKANPLAQLNSKLPPFEDLELFDGGSEDKWIVTAFLLASNGNDQELMKEGVEELRAFKALLEGSLDFEEMDRHDMDPRVR